jgi:hypothetical protein
MLEDFFLLLSVSQIYIYIPLFFHFLVFKIPKDEFFFFYLYYFLFFNFFPQFFFEKNWTDYICTHVIFWEFGLHFSNLHINAYHVFDANFD